MTAVSRAGEPERRKVPAGCLTGSNQMYCQPTPIVWNFVPMRAVTSLAQVSLND
jgi:hypothetical protein